MYYQGHNDSLTGGRRDRQENEKRQAVFENSTLDRQRKQCENRCLRCCYPIKHLSNSIGPFDALSPVPKPSSHVTEARQSDISRMLPAYHSSHFPSGNSATAAAAASAEGISPWRFRRRPCRYWPFLCSRASGRLWQVQRPSQGVVRWGGFVGLTSHRVFCAADIGFTVGMVAAPLVVRDAGALGVFVDGPDHVVCVSTISDDVLFVDGKAG